MNARQRRRERRLLDRFARSLSAVATAARGSAEALKRARFEPVERAIAEGRIVLSSARQEGKTRAAVHEAVGSLTPGDEFYVSCSVCGERAVLPDDAPSRDADGRRTTVGENRRRYGDEYLLALPWTCPRHRDRPRRYA